MSSQGMEFYDVAFKILEIKLIPDLARLCLNNMMFAFDDHELYALHTPDNMIIYEKVGYGEACLIGKSRTEYSISKNLKMIEIINDEWGVDKGRPSFTAEEFIVNSKVNLKLSVDVTVTYHGMWRTFPVLKTHFEIEECD